MTIRGFGGRVQKIDMDLAVPDWTRRDDETGLEGPADDSREAKILEMWQAEQSINQICQEVYGYMGGAAFYAVALILADHGIDVSAERAAKEQAEVQQVLDLWDGGEHRIAEISSQLFYSTGGGSWYKVRRILRENGRLEA